MTAVESRVRASTAAGQGAAELTRLVGVALEALAAGRAARPGPVPSGGPPAVAAAVDAALAGPVLPDHGIGQAAALSGLVAAFAAGSADPDDPRCLGHLHCPPLAVAVAADLVAAALNQSVDSWDQGPAAAALERRVIGELADLVGFRAGAGAVTTGGTESLYTALLLARDRAGGPARILAGTAAHFSVQRAARLLGLPPVLEVPSGADGTMCPAALAAALHAAPGGERPIVIATAGTTDLGLIDPLPALVPAVRAAGGWLHVDAAYGGGVLFSDRHAALLAGIAGADSVSLDLHKFGWQPAGAGILLTAQEAAFDALARRVAYLNPDDDAAAGYDGLLGRSLRTTRRADALKIAVTLRALGRAGLGERVDACLALARYAAGRVAARPELVLHADPVLSTVVFAYGGADSRHADPRHADAVNAALRRRLLAEGRAVIGRAELDGRVRLKLTLLNPAATTGDVDAVLDAVVRAGQAEDAERDGARD